MKTVKIGDVEVPEKIVVLNKDSRWDWLYGQVLTLSVDGNTRFTFPLPGNGRRSWFYPHELALEIQYISYERFLKLKAFA